MIERWSALVWQLWARYGDGIIFVHAAAIAFYALFSLPPIVVVILSIVSGLGLQKEMLHKMQSVLTELTGISQTEVLERAQGVLSLDQTQGVWLGLSLGFIIVTATTFFVTLHRILNQVFQVETMPGKAIQGLLRSRMVSALTVGMFAVILVLSLGLDTLSLTIRASLGVGWPFEVRWLSWSWLFCIVLFILMVIPDARVSFKRAWPGALLTTATLLGGRGLIHTYLSSSSIVSVYNAAGAIMLLLIWTQLAALLFLMGAHLSAAIIEVFDGGVQPKPGARRVLGSAH